MSVEPAPAASPKQGEVHEATAEGSNPLPLEAECTGEPLPSEAMQVFVRFASSYLDQGSEDPDELGTGRPLPSHLDDCLSVEGEQEGGM